MCSCTISLLPVTSFLYELSNVILLIFLLKLKLYADRKDLDREVKALLKERKGKYTLNVVDNFIVRARD